MNAGAVTADVLIVGGAAMGSSVAYHLLSDPAFRGRVVVVEKDPTYQRSASALSAASIRQQFSSPVNIRISLHGIAFLRAVHEHLAVGDEVPEIGALCWMPPTAPWSRCSGRTPASATRRPRGV